MATAALGTQGAGTSRKHLTLRYDPMALQEVICGCRTTYEEQWQLKKALQNISGRSRPPRLSRIVLRDAELIRDELL